MCNHLSGFRLQTMVRLDIRCCWVLCVTGCLEPELEDSLPRQSTQAQALQEEAPAAQGVVWGVGRGQVPHSGWLLGGAADRAVQGPRWEEAVGGG